MHQCCDNVQSFGFNFLNQIGTRSCLLHTGFDIACRKSITNLHIQVRSIGYHNHPRIGNRFNQVFNQHHHGERFTASLSMPNQTTATFTIFVHSLNFCDCLFDSKILLIACNFLDTVIINDKVPYQIEQSTRL